MYENPFWANLFSSSKSNIFQCLCNKLKEEGISMDWISALRISLLYYALHSVSQAYMCVRAVFSEAFFSLLAWLCILFPLTLCHVSFTIIISVAMDTCWTEPNGMRVMTYDVSINQLAFRVNLCVMREWKEKRKQQQWQHARTQQLEHFNHYLEINCLLLFLGPWRRATETKQNHQCYDKRIFSFECVLLLDWCTQCHNININLFSNNWDKWRCMHVAGWNGVCATIYFSYSLPFAMGI